jgi:hypothetical protein
MASPVDASDAEEDAVLSERYLTRDGRIRLCSINQILKIGLLDGGIRKDWTGTGTDNTEGVPENLPSANFYGRDSERKDTVKEPIDED